MPLKQLSKTLTQIEAGGPKSLQLLKSLYKRKRGVPILGITGLPGAGKSTLIDQIISHLRGQNKTVGVIAIDPSSPFSGGAVLGDRIRMQRHASDSGVFIRSVGSRGAHGGLSHAAGNLALAMDAAGIDRILIETVGVGQTELDIMGLATTTVVVLMPGVGDAIQTLKAGLMEIADIFAINKSDLAGAESMQKMLLALGTVPVLLTQADAGKGVEELMAAIEKNPPPDENHRQSLRRDRFLELVGQTYKQKIQNRLLKEAKWKTLLQQVAQDRRNPFEALDEVLKSFK